MSLAKWTLGTFGAQIIGVFFVALGGMINSRLLGPEGKGIVALIFLYPDLFAFLFQLSLASPYLHHLGRAKYKLGNFAANSLFLTGILSGLAIFVFWTTFFFFREQLYPKISGIYLAPAMLLTPFLMIINFSYAILQGSYNIRDLNLVGLTWKIGGTILIILLVFILKLGVWGAIIGGSVAILFTAVAGVYFVARITKKEDWQIQPELLKETLKDGAKLHIGGIAGYICNRANMFLLNYYLGAREVGLFSVAFVVSWMLDMISQSTQTILCTKTSSANEIEAARLTGLVVRHALLWTIIAGIILAMGARFFIWLFAGKAFFAATSPLIILIPGMVARAISYNTSALIIRNRQFLWATYIYCSSAAINILLCIILIPRYNLIGAALATIIPQILVAIIFIFIFCFFGKRGPKELFCFTKEDILLYRNLVARIYEKVVRLKK
jgi:O-antigen/teichoic acid export membrane protein